MAGGIVLFAVDSAAFVIGGHPHLLGAARFARGAGSAAFCRRPQLPWRPSAARNEACGCPALFGVHSMTTTQHPDSGKPRAHQSLRKLRGGSAGPKPSLK